MRNVHIYPSSFTHESRILKEAKSLRDHLGYTEILLVGVKTKGLPSSERVDDVTTIYRLGPAKGAHGLAKLVMHALWCVHTLFFILWRRPNCVNCHSLPVLPIGVVIKLLTGAKLVYDAHELETETAGLAGGRKAVSKLVERVFIHVPDLIVVVGPGIERWYRERYSVASIIVLLNVPHYVEASASTVLRRQLAIPDDFRILLYQGGLSVGRGIEELIDAAEVLGASKYAVVFMGYGPLEGKVREASTRLKTVYYQSAVPPSELLRYTSSADVGIVSVQDSCLSYRLSLPNKLFEYIMGGLPVIVSSLPEMKAFVADNGVGCGIPTWGVEELVLALQTIESMRGPDLNARIGNVALKYCWEREEEKLIAGYRRYLGVPQTADASHRITR